MSEAFSAPAVRRRRVAAAIAVNDNAHLHALDGVRASINYLERTGERPRAYQYDPPPGVPTRTGSYAPVPVLVRNGRTLEGRLSLDREGFALTRAPTAFTRFADAEAVKAAYYPEVEALVKRATGAARVVVFDHTVRHAPTALEKRAGVREPVKRAHTTTR